MKHEIEALKRMIESCYTYGGAGKETFNYEHYIHKYEEILGKKLFEKIYTEHLSNLILNYSVVDNVYTDFEGLTYNSLVKNN